ncbi:MAG: metallophosphoesterase [Lachnospiraceae bacterium]|nr:metallophosphoesterase [Lachnospiraceae bacterium]
MILCAATLSGCTNQPVSNSNPIVQDNLIEEYLVIEGLDEEYNILFLTDTHMVVPSEEDSEQVAANAQQRLPMFQNAEGVSSAEQFPSWMDYAVDNQVDAVLFGGDIIDYPSHANLEYLQTQLEQLDMPYLYTPGNHDWTYPWEYMTDKGKTEYLPLLEPMMQGNTVIQSLDMGEFVVVAVDNSSNQVNDEALETYQEILSQDKPVIVMVHVPFLTQSVLTKAKEQWSSPVVIGGGNYGGIYPNEASRIFVQETTSTESPVEAVLAGHVHYYDKDYMDGEKKVVQLVGDAGYKGKGMLLHISGKEEQK